jgi:uncharacterized protein YcaQ
MMKASWKCTRTREERIMAKATLIEIRDYFRMTGSEIARDWKVLSEEEKEFFRVEVAKAIGKSGE